MDYLMLVSRFEPLQDGFEQKLKLREVRGRLFEKQTADSLEKLLLDAKRDGIEPAVISGYRAADYQQMLWEREISKEMAKKELINRGWMFNTSYNSFFKLKKEKEKNKEYIEGDFDFFDHEKEWKIKETLNFKFMLKLRQKLMFIKKF